MNLLRASANRFSACGRALRPWLWRTLLPAAVLDMPSGSHAERPVQGSRRQEYWAAHAAGPRAQQASKLEAWTLFARSEGGTVARAGGNTCAPLSAHLEWQR
jgi:hypothetical protein